MNLDDAGPPDARDPLDADDRPLEHGEVEEMRELLGRSTAEQSDRAIGEVERQVALEDLVLLMVEGVTEAAHSFVSFLIELNRDPASETDAVEPAEEKP